MRKRRILKNEKNLAELCSGPGKLCQAMGIDRSCDGLRLTSNELWIEEEIPFVKVKNRIDSSARVGIEYAAAAKEWPLFASRS